MLRRRVNDSFSKTSTEGMLVRPFGVARDLEQKRKNLSLVVSLG